MMSKVVLLGYLERKKRIAIAEKRTENELEYLKEEFLKSFNLQSTVKPHQITFQRFDPEWDEYVDVEEGDVLVNKDKLKVVVSPCQWDTVPSAVVAIASSENQRPSGGEVTEVEVNLQYKYFAIANAPTIYLHIRIHPRQSVSILNRLNQLLVV